MNLKLHFIFSIDGQYTPHLRSIRADISDLREYEEIKDRRDLRK
jgi:hypothetical protein